MAPREPRRALLGKCWETQEGGRRKREIKETGEVRRGGDGNRKRYEMRRDAGGSRRKGLDSPPPSTPAHTPSICRRRGLGCRSVTLGPGSSFTLGPGATWGWELVGSAGGGGRAGGCGAGSRRCSPVSLLPAAYLVQAVRAAGKCDAVFKGFSDCLLKLGDSMANYPQGLDDKTNIKTVCT